MLSIVRTSQAVFIITQSWITSCKTYLLIVFLTSVFTKVSLAWTLPDLKKWILKKSKLFFNPACVWRCP